MITGDVPKYARGSAHPQRQPAEDDRDVEIGTGLAVYL